MRLISFFIALVYQPGQVDPAAAGPTVAPGRTTLSVRDIKTTHFAAVS